MSFVNEEITAQDRTRNPIIAAGIKVPNSAYLAEVSRWTINRNSGDFLLFVQGGSSEIPFYYAFYFQGSLFGLWLKKSFDGDLDQGFNVQWAVVGCDGDAASYSSGDFRATLNDAFQAHGSFYSREKIRSVQLSFGAQK